MKNQDQTSLNDLIKRYQQRSKLAWQWLIGQNNEADASLNTLDIDIGKATHVFLMLLCALTLAFIAWACFGHLDVASSAQGSVSPSSQGKSIQHLEGGIVQSILVKEGDNVSAGQPLVTLESTARNADVEQLKIKIAALNIDIKRLESELNSNQDLAFNQELINNHPKLVIEAKKLNAIRQQRHLAKVRSQSHQIKQRQAEVAEVKARIKNTSIALGLVNEQVKISKDLLKDDLTNRYNHIDLLKSANKLQSRIDEDQANLMRTNAALDEENADLAGINHQHKEEVSTKLEESRRELNELLKQMNKYADNLKRTVITAPVAGVVKELFVFTRGGVIKPGQTLLDIIPSNDQLIIDAKLPVKDIGYIKIGQAATIQLASPDASHFAKIEGKVTFISPDTILPDNNDVSGMPEPYYKVRIVTDKDHFSGRGLKYKLYPGVHVSVNILTGSRSIMSYLLSPFSNSFHNALKER